MATKRNTPSRKSSKSMGGKMRILIVFALLSLSCFPNTVQIRFDFENGLDLKPGKYLFVIDRENKSADIISCSESKLTKSQKKDCEE